MNAKEAYAASKAVVDKQVVDEEKKWRSYISSSTKLGMFDCRVSVSAGLGAAKMLANKFTREGYRVQAPNFNTVKISWEHAGEKTS